MHANTLNRQTVAEREAKFRGAQFGKSEVTYTQASPIFPIFFLQ
jgi:hypothetical protein